MFTIFELYSKLFVKSFDENNITLSEIGKVYTELDNLIKDLKILDEIKANKENFKIFKL